MHIHDLGRCAIEARDADIRQQMQYDEGAGRYTDTPQRDDEGRYIYTVQVDLLSDVEAAMSTETLTIHSLEAPVLHLTEMHQRLDADNLRLEIWRSRTRAGHSLHCDGLRVATVKPSKGE